MQIDAIFLFNSILLGVGLAMDAFSVSVANGLRAPCMRRGRMVLIAGVFAFFQALMPMLGWLLVHTLLQFFTAFEPAIPWIALALLGFLGGKMLYEGIKGEEECCDGGAFCIGGLLLQGVATSIDALSVGLTISEYGPLEAILAAGIIAAVTFALCFLGVFLGKKFGAVFRAKAGRANILGGVILILIGIEIFVTGLLGL